MLSPFRVKSYLYLKKKKNNYYFICCEYEHSLLLFKSSHKWKSTSAKNPINVSPESEDEKSQQAVCPAPQTSTFDLFACWAGDKNEKMFLINSRLIKIQLQMESSTTSVFVCLIDKQDQNMF